MANVTVNEPLDIWGAKLHLIGRLDVAPAAPNEKVSAGAFSPWSRAVITIMEKGQGSPAVAKINLSELQGIKVMAEEAFKQSNGPSAAKPVESTSAAYTERIAFGPLKGQTPASALSDNPQNELLLRQHYEMLQNNVQQGGRWQRANQVKMAAITEAINLLHAGKLQKQETKSLTIYPASMRNGKTPRNGKDRWYSLGIEYVNDKVYVVINEMYAATKVDPSGTMQMIPNTIEDKRTVSFAADPRLFYNGIADLCDQVNALKKAWAPSVYEQHKFVPAKQA